MTNEVQTAIYAIVNRELDHAIYILVDASTLAEMGELHESDDLNFFVKGLQDLRTKIKMRELVG